MKDFKFSLCLAFIMSVGSYSAIKSLSDSYKSELKAIRDESAKLITACMAYDRYVLSRGLFNADYGMMGKFGYGPEYLAEKCK